MSARRKFLQQWASAAGMTWLGYQGYRDLLPHGRAATADESRGSEQPVAHPDASSASAGEDGFDRVGPVEAAFFESDGLAVTCKLCPRHCRLRDGRYGVCRVRVARDGVLYSEGYGNLCAMHLDPIEKKPLYHFLPRSRALSIAMGGCNLRCPNCQNWEISQAHPQDVARFDVSPAKLSRLAEHQQASSIAYTYTEPVMTYEYTRDASHVARSKGLKNVLVSAGFISEKPMRQLARLLDAATIDVKSFDPQIYRRFNRGNLATVLRTLEVLREQGVWLEVSFLLVTGVTDDPAQVKKLARWMVEHLGEDTPLHLLRFYPAYRMRTLPPTAMKTMNDAWSEARESGLHYVYLGNTPGERGANTVCPYDGQLLIRRRGYQVVENRLVEGRCPACGHRIAGVW